MEVKYIVSNKELDILDSYFTYGHDDPCVRCPPRSKMEYCGCFERTEYEKCCEFFKDGLHSEILQCQPIVDYVKADIKYRELREKLWDIQEKLDKAQSRKKELIKKLTIIKE